MATTTIDRLDFGVSWNAPLEKDGLVVGNTVEITINAEAILEASSFVLDARIQAPPPD